MLSLLVSVALAALPDVDDPIRTGDTRPDDAAVVIGLEDYVFLPDVPYAANDARAVEDFLVSTRGVPSERVERLSQAGKEQIEAAVLRASTATGTVWVYLAGHGVAAPSSGERLFLGDDARQDPAAFEARGVSLAHLEELGSAGGAEVVLIVDACFNGRARDGASMAEGTRFAVPVYAHDTPSGSVHWAASGPDQLARPLDAAEHGAFTYALLGALRGEDRRVMELLPSDPPADLPTRAAWGLLLPIAEIRAGLTAVHLPDARLLRQSVSLGMPGLFATLALISEMRKANRRTQATSMERVFTLECGRLGVDPEEARPWLERARRSRRS